MESSILQAVSNVGFPIAITFYLFYRFERILDNHTSAIHELIMLMKNRK